MTEQCIDNLYVKPLEVCNFKALLELENTNSENFPMGNNYSPNTLFSDTFKTTNPDLNSNLRDASTNEYKYTYDATKKDLCHQLQNNSNNYRVNCVIATHSPFFTYNEKKKTCSPIPGLELPKNFNYKYENDNTYIYKVDDDESLKFNYLYKMQQAFCENKWYDWIITPNYHFGNQYEKDEGIYTKEDVRRCYKPCNKGYMPYTALNGSNICVLKTEILDGLYKNKLDYSPIALINLIGNTTSNLTNLYNLTNYIQLEKKYSGSKNDNYEINDVLKNDIIKDNYIKNEIATLYNSIKDVVVNDILDENNFNIDNYQLNKKVLTYKNPNFNEDDKELLTYRGLSSSDMLTDEILFHTFFIANKYEQHISNIIDTIKNKLHNTGATALNYDTEVTKNEYNIANTIIQLINDKILQKENALKYIQRIANIFYKAINICYDNKTDFSKNIMIKTKNVINKFNTNATDRAKIKEIYYPTDTTDITSKLTALNNKDNIIITYYDEKEYRAITEIKLTTTTDQTDDGKKKMAKEQVITDVNRVKLNLVFYTLEDNEKNNNNCRENNIYNIETKRCEPCRTACSIDNYKKNSRCNIFCKEECEKHEKKNNKNNISRCGISKVKINNETPLDNIETPLNETNFEFLSNISYILRYVVRMFFYAIILYLCYIFYQLYGETILTIFNLISYYFWLFVYKTMNIIGSNEYKADYQFDEYKKQNAAKKYERLVTKANSIKI